MLRRNSHFHAVSIAGGNVISQTVSKFSVLCGSPKTMTVAGGA